MTELELLECYRRTAFAFGERGRMTYETAPDRSRGPRFALFGCRGGNLAVIRDDVSEEAAARLELLSSGEDPLASADAVPTFLDSFVAALAVDGSEVVHRSGLLWVFASPLPYRGEARLVRSGTPAGDGLLARFGDAMSDSLVEIGFRDPSDLWAPWCVVLENDKVVAIAETVRRGPVGAEVGVDTAVGFRGRGLAAAATAGWSRHPDLGDATLFYGTSQDNMSSRQVTQRLGLRLLGATFSLS